MIILLDDDRNYVNIIYIWVYYNDLTVLPHWNHGFYMGNHPQMAELFRLLKLLVVWNIFCFSIYWEQSSQLTNIFQRGGSTTNQEILL